MAYSVKYIVLSQLNSESQIPTLINQIAMGPYSYFADADQGWYADLCNCADDIISGGNGRGQPSWTSSQDGLNIGQLLIM